MGFGGLGGSFLESILRYFGLQVGGLGSKLEAWEALLESILSLVGVWEAKRQQGRGLEGLGLAQEWLGTCKWGQLDPSWSPLGHKLEAHFGPICGSLAAPGPTQALPDPFSCIKELTPNFAGPGQ